jgi:hypothetical protein
MERVGAKLDKAKVLGSLVDRAVSMPYSKPKQLKDGYRLEWDAQKRRPDKERSITEDTADAAESLRSALTDPTVGDDWSKAELCVDQAGPWWAKSRNDFCGLTPKPDAQDWVIDRLAATVERAANAIQAAAMDEQWTWLWSQPSFAVPGKNYPRITRPDLVAGLSPKRCLVIDMKTTSGELDRVNWSIDDFNVWTGHLEAAGFEVVGRWVLAISTLQGDPQDKTKWIPVSDRGGSTARGHRQPGSVDD